jgi:transcriptional regulator with PAS, ATPase and Fis domain
MSSVENDKLCPGYAMSIGPSAPIARIGARQGERRKDLRQVIRAVAATLLNRNDERALPSVFEQALAQVVPVRGIRLRETPSRYQARLITPARTSDAVVLDVPATDPGRQFVLETIVDPARPLDDWNIELLSTAALLATLVLDVESRRGPTMAAARLDGAAPLIGSTPVMRALRERVERVAGTDFMVLIEGESGTGKELVARQIHELSWRRKGPFVALNVQRS